MHLRCVAAACLAAVAAVAACAPGEPPGPLVHVDDEGWFVSAESVTGRWYPAAGVRILAPHEADGPLLGRLDGEPDAAEVATFDAEGVLQFVPLRREPSPEPRGDEVRRAVAAALDGLAGTLAPALAAGLRAPPAVIEPVPGITIDPSDLLPGDGLVPGGAPPPPGAPLSAWAPRQFAFARFRSVEAGFRLAGTFDEFIGHVLAGHGDARDAATLRLTLFHLLLPTIWRTNPGVSKGVSEMALVVAPPYSRGPLAAAVLLRIEDPDRHAMHTKAGVAIESKPDHQWRPERDPFPMERVRRSVRRIIGDVEIVATDAALLDWLSGGVPDTWADDSDAAVFLADPGAGPGDFAVAAVFPPGGIFDVDAALAARATRGVVHLLRALGAEEASVQPRFGRAPFPVRRLAIRTDRAGAHVTATLDGSSSALIDAITHGTEPDSRHRYADACAASRGDLAALALVDGADGDLPERALVLFGFSPRCPEGGVLRPDPVTRGVTCSLHGPPDVRAEVPGRGGVESPYRALSGDAHEIQIVIPIDWSGR